MPKILGHKFFNLVIDKGPYAKTIKFDIEKLYEPHEKDTEETRD